MKSISLKNRIIKNELFLYLGILLLASFLRFPFLGNPPLNDVEAKLALSALDIQKGAPLAQSAQPLYISLTSLLFILSSNNFTARIVSAIAGCFFTLTPIFFKKWIGSKEALLVGFFFAIDPALISISRQADSRMMALLILVLFIASLFFSEKIFTGLTGGLLILCGFYFWQLCLLIFILLIFYYQISKGKNKIKLKINRFKTHVIEDTPYQLILGFFVSLLFIGTRLLSRPGLLNLIPQSLFSLINDWFIKGQLFNQSSFLIIFFISGYPLLILFCLAGIVQELIRKDKLSFFLLILLLLSFLFFLANPFVKPVDIYLFVFPMYYFVAKGFLSWWELFKEQLKEGLVISVPVICLLGFIWLAILRMLNLPIGSIDTAQMLIALIGSLLLLGIIIVLIGWGWSVRSAISGLSLAIILILSIFQFSVSIHSTGLTSRPESELWSLEKYFKGSELLMSTIKDISLWNSGFKQRIDVAIVGIDAPSIIWALKDQIIEKYDVIPSTRNASIVITKEGNEQTIDEKDYRGQKFALHSFPIWTINLEQSLTSIDFYRWLLLRDGYIKDDEIELWARADLFVGNNRKFESNY